MWLWDRRRVRPRESAPPPARLLAPLQPKNKQNKKRRSGEEPSSSRSFFFFFLTLITSLRPPRSHGNLVAMVARHSNPVVKVKSGRNANTHFIFLRASERAAPVPRSVRWSRAAEDTSGSPTIVVKMKTRGLGAFVLNV